MELADTCPDTLLEALARALGQRLLARGARVALAESCTGGWIAKQLTDVAGSSQWFERGYVTYSNTAKQQDLGVPAELLARHGAVSREVVEAMARGALERSGAQLSAAVSGIAGPDGGSPDKPVGTVWLAVACGHDRSMHSQLLELRGDREHIRRVTVAAALRWLAELA